MIGRILNLTDMRPRCRQGVPQLSRGFLILFEIMGYIFPRIVRVVDRRFTGFTHTFRGLFHGAIRQMIGFFRAVGRFHRDCLCSAIDTLDGDHACFETVLANVIHFIGRLHGALFRVMDDDFIAFLQALKRILASRGCGFGPMIDRVGGEVNGVLGSVGGSHGGSLCAPVNAFYGDYGGFARLASSGGKSACRNRTPETGQTPRIFRISDFSSFMDFNTESGQYRPGIGALKPRNRCGKPCTTQTHETLCIFEPAWVGTRGHLVRKRP